MPTGENLTLAWTPFALDETAGDASAGVSVFAVVNRQREEVDSLARIGIRRRGREHYVVADAHHYRTVGLLG